MNEWVRKIEAPMEVEVLEESALAMAQSTIQNAVDQAGISRAEMARKMKRPRSFVSRMLGGSHNLTIKTMSRALWACGFEVRFQTTPVVWTWKAYNGIQTEVELPAQAGSSMPVAMSTASIELPVCA
jgi:plasmid maintenance system antidote protein VapI